eukprot:scaffold1581_cov124-Skeletonema_dohrnii-CCMP3373.AAC.2
MKNARRTTSHLGYSPSSHMNRDFNVPQKLLDFVARMSKGSTHPGQTFQFQGRDQASEDDVTMEY